MLNHHSASAQRMPAGTHGHQSHREMASLFALLCRSYLFLSKDRKALSSYSNIFTVPNSTELQRVNDHPPNKAARHPQPRPKAFQHPTSKHAPHSQLDSTSHACPVKKIQPLSCSENPFSCIAQIGNSAC